VSEGNPLLVIAYFRASEANPLLVIAYFRASEGNPLLVIAYFRALEGIVRDARGGETKSQQLSAKEKYFIIRSV
jgi:hypothetical protein